MGQKLLRWVASRNEQQFLQIWSSFKILHNWFPAMSSHKLCWNKAKIKFMRQEATLLTEGLPLLLWLSYLTLNSLTFISGDIEKWRKSQLDFSLMLTSLTSSSWTETAFKKIKKLNSKKKRSSNKRSATKLNNLSRLSTFWIIKVLRSLPQKNRFSICRSKETTLTTEIAGKAY